MATDTTWFYWALWSAVFAALTAIFAKLGLEGVDPDLATLVRTAVIIVVLAGFVYATGKWSNPLALRSKTWLFLVLSGLATGASWVCYFRALKVGDASKVAPVDKLSLVLVAAFAFMFLGERPLGPGMARDPHGGGRRSDPRPQALGKDFLFSMISLTRPSGTAISEP
jgi:bacterial/archaeal transporter family protein